MPCGAKIPIRFADLFAAGCRMEDLRHAFARPTADQKRVREVHAAHRSNVHDFRHAHPGAWRRRRERAALTSPRTTSLQMGVRRARSGSITSASSMRAIVGDSNGVTGIFITSARRTSQRHSINARNSGRHRACQGRTIRRPCVRISYSRRADGMFQRVLRCCEHRHGRDRKVDSETTERGAIAQKQCVEQQITEDRSHRDEPIGKRARNLS